VNGTVEPVIAGDPVVAPHGIGSAGIAMGGVRASALPRGAVAIPGMGDERGDPPPRFPDRSSRWKCIELPRAAGLCANRWNKRSSGRG